MVTHVLDAGLMARENSRLLSVGQVTVELEPRSLSATRHNCVFPPSSHVSSRQNLCQGVDCFVALTVFQAGRNNEASANSRPLTITLHLWWWHFGFKFKRSCGRRYATVAGHSNHRVERIFISSTVFIWKYCRSVTSNVFCMPNTSVKY